MTDKKRFPDRSSILIALANGHGVAHDDYDDVIELGPNGLQFTSGEDFQGLFLDAPPEGYYQVEAAAGRHD